MAMEKDPAAAPPRPSPSPSSWVDRIRMAPLPDASSGLGRGTTDDGEGEGEGSRSPLEFNVASLNVLAESYLTPRSHPGLPERYAEVAFVPAKRRQLLVDTLGRFCRPAADSGADARGECDKWDVLALQELDLLGPDEGVLPALEAWGYRMVRTPVDDRRDCCAIAFDTRKFSLVDHEVVRFDDLATLQSADRREKVGDAPLTDGYSKIRPKKKPNSPSELTGMVRSFLRRNCAVVARLESIETKESLVVASVHLYWHPGYEYVKLCQAKHLLDRVAAFASKKTVGSIWTTPTNESETGALERIPTIICGDMNSKPGSIVHKLFVTPHVDARTVAPWRYFWDREDEEMYTEEAEDSLSDAPFGAVDRKDGQDPVAAVDPSLAEEGDVSEHDNESGHVMSELQKPPPGGTESNQGNENGYMMSGLNAEFGLLCMTIDSNDDNSDEKVEGGAINGDTERVSHIEKDIRIPEEKAGASDNRPNVGMLSENKGDITTIKGAESSQLNGNGYVMSGLRADFSILCTTFDSNGSKSNKEVGVSAINGDTERAAHIEKNIKIPERNAGTDDSNPNVDGLPEINGDIITNKDELQATLEYRRRLNGHMTPQDYQHSTPPLPVKYMLDYTLNRFTRWLRILGIDATLETAEEEKERTSGGNIALFDHCRKDHRTLLTSSYKLMLRKECPPGAYLLDPKSTSHLEQALPRLLRTHGIELSPCTFLTRCVLCNGIIRPVVSDEDKKAVFIEQGAPGLVDCDEEMEVFRCDACSQGYWWDSRESSSASRVFAQATHLLQLCLRGGVDLKDEATADEKKRKVIMGAFDFISIEKEREGDDTTKQAKEPELVVIEWLREEQLTNPFHLKSAYAAEGNAIREVLPFTNVTKEFVGCLDYTYFEPKRFDQICRLTVPTSFKGLNASSVDQGHLIPSDIWPSDHIAVGARFRLRQGKNLGGRRKRVNSNIKSEASTDETFKNGNADNDNGENGINDRDKNKRAELQPHPTRCDCGCVPKILSLFEMAELRKKAREKKG